MLNDISGRIKKAELSILLLSPFLIGFLHNHLVLPLPFIIYIGPLILLSFWFWAGTLYAERVSSPFKAILSAHMLGFFAFAIYYWQFILLGDLERNRTLALFSQLFSLPLAYLTAKIGMLFEHSPNEITWITAFAMQAVGLALMLLVFCAGYFHRRNRLKVSAA